MSARSCASSVFCLVAAPTQAFQKLATPKTIVAATRSTARGVKRARRCPNLRADEDGPATGGRLSLQCGAAPESDGGGAGLSEAGASRAEAAGWAAWAV